MTLKRGANIKYLPYAFTEHGVVMAANVLNSEQAVTMSVYVVRAFVKLREILAGSKELASKLEDLERKLTARQDVHEKAILQLFSQIRNLLTSPPTHPEQKRKQIGFRPKALKSDWVLPGFSTPQFRIFAIPSRLHRLPCAKPPAFLQATKTSSEAPPRLVVNNLETRYSLFTIPLVKRAGARSLEEVRIRIGKYRKHHIGPTEDPHIGCILLGEPFFFEESEWILRAPDFKGPTQVGKSYDVEHGTGLMLTEPGAVATGSQVTPHPTLGPATLAAIDPPRYGARDLF